MAFEAPLQRGARLFARVLQRVTRLAERAQRADGTARRARPADRCAEVHQGRVPLRHALLREQTGGLRPENSSAGRGVDRRGQAKEAAENAGDVGLHQRQAGPKGENGDGPGGVIAAAGEGPNFLQRAGKGRAWALRDLPGRPVKMAGPRVVTEPLPFVQDIILLRGGEGGQVGKTLQPANETRRHRGDRGLLQHHFRDHDGVRITSLPPGEIASLFPVP